MVTQGRLAQVFQVLTLLCLMLPMASHSYGTSLQPYSVSPDDSTAANITSFSAYSLEAPASLDLSDPSKLKALPWTATGQNNHLSLGSSGAAHWVRIALRNPSSSPLRRMLELSNPLIESLEILVHSPDGDTRYQLGSIYPFHERVVEHRTLVVAVDLPPEAITTIYLRLQSTKFLTFAINLYSQKQLQTRSSQDHLLAGLFYGAMLSTIIFALYQWHYRRQSLQLYLLAMTGCAILFNATQTGYGFQYLWPDNIWINSRNPIFFSCLASLLSSLFALAFLEDYQPRELTRRCLGIAAAINGLIALAIFVFPYRAMLIVALAATMAALATCLVASSLAALSRRPSALIFCCGWLVLLVGTNLAIAHLYTNAVLDLSAQGAELSTIASTLMWIWALCEREREITNRSNQLHAEQLDQMTHTALGMESEIQQLQEQAQRQQKMLRESDRLDPVTGLLNNAAFAEAMDREHRTALRHGNSLSVLALEVRDLNRCYDEQGQLAGDALLASLAHVIEAVLLRPADTPGHITHHTLGIVLPYTDINGALEILQRLRKQLQHSDSGSAAIGIAAGVASTDSQLARHAEDLVQSAIAQLKSASPQW